jgi:hypothetical protein
MTEMREKEGRKHLKKDLAVTVLNLPGNAL